MSTQNSSGQAEDRSRAVPRGWWWRPVVLVVAIVLLWYVGRRCDLGEKLTNIRAWMQRLGPLGPVAFVMLRAGAAVAMIQGTAISAAAGVIFGTVTGIICVSAGKTLGAATAFLISRYVARDAVARWLARKPVFRSLDRLVREHGAVFVALMRLFPLVPFTVQNYAFGLTGIPFGTYLLWSWLGMLPWAIVVVVGMNIVVETLATGRVPWALLVLLGVTLLVILALVAWTFLRLRAAMRVSGGSEAGGTDEATPPR